MTEQPKKVFSLLQLLQSVSSIIAKTYNRSYWIKAEIAKINEYKYSGHCYPELVEKQEGKVVAQIRAIIWDSVYKKIRQKFESVTKEPLKEGMMVVLLVRVDFNPLHGFSLNISDIDPAYTLGDMMREKNQAIERLQKEGVFGKNKLQRLPELPRKIAVISVETSKGFNDFRNVLADYQHKYQPYVHLFPALLQGDKAVESLLKALYNISRAAHLFDAVLMLRGGGSDIGLNCYDDYELAAAVANFPIPVITGIGHSTNETVVEMVSWRNMITPTETAYFLMGKYAEFDQSLQTLFTKISKVARDDMERANILLNSRSLQLKNIVQHKNLTCISKLSLHVNKLNTLIDNNINNNRRELLILQERLKEAPQNTLIKKANQLAIQQNLLLQMPGMSFQNAENKIAINEIKIQAYNPDSVLDKGFSITRWNNRIATDTEEMKVGDLLTTELKKGTITSEIKEITSNG